MLSCRGARGNVVECTGRVVPPSQGTVLQSLWGTWREACHHLLPTVLEVGPQESKSRPAGGPEGTMSVGNSVTYLPPELRPPRTPSFSSLNKDFALLKPDKPKLLRGPRRVVRLCMFAVVLPAVLITIPLYVRLVIYPPGHYPMMPTDQRLLAHHVSTFWCQAQTTHMNGSFNGYLAKGAPSLDPRRRTHVMTNQLTLKDDVKEYWGFYFLKGSTITISSCARWDGGQLMILRGVENLRRCAWIGEEDSAEDMAEDDDVASEERHKLEREQEGRGLRVLPAPEGHPDPERPLVTEDADLERSLVTEDADLERPLVIEEYAGATDDPSARPHLQSQERRLSITQLLRKAIKMSKDKKEILRILHSESQSSSFGLQNQLKDKEATVKNNDTRSTTFVPVDGVVEEQRVNQTSFPDIREAVVSSGDMRSLRDRLRKNSRKLKDEIQPSSRRRPNGRRRKKKRKKGNPREENLTEELLSPRDDSGSRSRRKRFIEDDADDVDGAFEKLEADQDLDEANPNGKASNISSAERAVGGQIFFPKGLTFERGTLNQTTTGDKSREEHKSSYSSSEEALASCEGVILTLPLTPHRSCSQSSTGMNKIIYDIPVTGTYYFVFSSDNEVFVNDLFFNLTMERVVYKVGRSDEVCVNATDCSMLLGFWSDDQAVVEVPREAGWDRSYVLDTKCEPRVYLYLAFLLLVPLCIMCCAFR